MAAIGVTPSLAGARVVMVVNAEWYFLSHRLSLATALRAAGADVTVMTEDERGQVPRILAAGFAHERLPLDRRSLNPLTEASAFTALARVYRRIKPDIVHHITIKPVIYGSMVARWLGVPAVLNTVPGLGFMFAGTGAKAAVRQRVATTLYRVALGGRHTRVIVQNDDDRDLFVARRVVTPERITVIRGSGVDPGQFPVTPEPPGPPIVLFASRLLWDKGVGEFVALARTMRRAGRQARFVVVGTPDVENPGHVPEATVREWVAEGIVEWWGHRADMPAVLAQSSLVVLPTRYPEGVPKILIEAASCGRAIVTADVPGCRDIVVNGTTGVLVPATAGGDALVEAVARLLDDPARRAAMGAAGRARVEAHFSEAQVLRETLHEYVSALAGAR